MKTSSCRFFKTFCALAVANLALAWPASATTFTWIGTTNGAWGTATNWAGGIAPAFNGTEDIIIPTTPVTTSGTLGATRDVRTISIQNDGGSIGAAGQYLKIESGLSMNAGTATQKHFYSDASLRLGANNIWDIAQNNYLHPRNVDFGSGYSLTKTGAGTLYLNWPMEGTGTLVVSGGTADVWSDFTSVLTGVTINGGGRLYVDNPQSNQTNRFSDTMPFAMGIGTFDFSGRNTNDSSETIGALTVTNGVGVVKISPNGATSTRLTVASYTRGANGWVAFTAASGTLGGTSTIKFTSAPAMTNGIIPYASLDADLATYDATNGVVPASYQSTTLAGIAAATDNVKISANETLLADKTVNALVVAAPGGVNGNGINLGGKTLTISSGNLVLGNDLNQLTNGTIAFGAAEGFIYGRSRNFLENAITGSGGLSLGGQVTLNNVTMSYTGATHILGSITLGLANSNKIPDTSAVTIALGGEIIQDGRLNLNETIGSLAGEGTVNITPNAGNSMTMFAGGDNTSTTFSGVMKGSFGFTKQGTGTFTFSGASTTTGTTTVSTGVMIVTGSISAGPTIVATSGTLGGNGLLSAVTLNSGGLLAPGSSGTANTGILTVTSLSGSAGSHLTMEINGTTAGTGADQVVTTGVSALTLAGDLKLTIGTGYAPVGTDTISLINNTGTGAVSGIFSGLSVTDNSGTNSYAGTEGTLLNLNGQAFQLTYLGGDGNDVALMAIPEPSTWAMLLGGFGLLTLVQRMRRRSVMA